MKKIILLMTLFMCFICSSCNKQKDTIVIGLNLELSGRFSQYGRACLEGVQLAVEQKNRQGGISGMPVILKVLDNRSENSEAALGAIRLSDNKQVCAIIGPVTSNGVKAAMESGITIPMITPSATADSLTQTARNNLFRLCFTDSVQGRAMGEYAAALGYKRVALIVDIGSEYSVGVADAFAQTFVSHGGTIAATVHYTANDTDFSIILTKLKAQSFEACYLPGYYTEAGLIIRQARGLGINVPFLSGDAFDSPLLDSIAGGSANTQGCIFTNHFGFEGQQEEQFIKDFEARYQQKPQAYSALGYDAANFLMAGIQRGGTRRQSLKAALCLGEIFNGVTGSFVLDQNNNAIKEVRLIMIDQGLRKPVKLKAKDGGVIGAMAAVD